MVLAQSYSVLQQLLTAYPPQVTLKNYDPLRDRRFSGTFKLPTIPRYVSAAVHASKQCTALMQPSHHSDVSHLSEGPYSSSIRPRRGSGRLSIQAR